MNKFNELAKELTNPYIEDPTSLLSSILEITRNSSFVWDSVPFDLIQFILRTLPVWQRQFSAQSAILAVKFLCRYVKRHPQGCVKLIEALQHPSFNVDEDQPLSSSASTLSSTSRFIYISSIQHSQHSQQQHDNTLNIPFNSLTFILSPSLSLSLSLYIFPIIILLLILMSIYISGKYRLLTKMLRHQKTFVGALKLLTQIVAHTPKPNKCTLIADLMQSAVCKIVSVHTHSLFYNTNSNLTLLFSLSSFISFLFILIMCCFFLVIIE
jgi:hypothetical protein